MSDASLENVVISEFAGQGADYYARVFSRIRNYSGFSWSFSWAAAFLGPVWAVARGIPVLFWLTIFLETLAVAQFATGFAGNLGGEQRIRAERLIKQAAECRVDAQQAMDSGESSADSMMRSAVGLKRAADNAARQARPPKPAAPSSSAPALSLCWSACLQIPCSNGDSIAGVPTAGCGMASKQGRHWQRLLSALSPIA